MAILHVGDVVEVKFVMQADDQAGINVRHYRIDNLEDAGATQLSFLTHLTTVFPNLYRALLNENAEFVGISAQKVFPQPVVAADVSTVGAGAGLDGGDLMARQVSGLISLYSELAGPGFRGRTYVPFASEARNNVLGHPDANYSALLSSLGDALVNVQNWNTAGGSNTATPVVFNRLTHVTTTLVEAIPRPRWATQRRRGDYGRPNQPQL